MEWLEKVANKTNKKTIKLSAAEIFELQICASVLDFINNQGNIDDLKRKLEIFLKDTK